MSDSDDGVFERPEGAKIFKFVSAEQADAEAEVHVRMMAQAFDAEITDFMVGLSPRHAFLVAAMLRGAADNPNEGYLMSGRLIGLLEFVHKANPHTGLPFGQGPFGGDPL